MLSQKARYALRALLYLAGRGDSVPVQISEIAEREKIEMEKETGLTAPKE